jgi:hypothetical protein
MKVALRSNALPIFERLQGRGIGQDQYTQIKKIVILETPQAAVAFQRQFPKLTPKQVLQKVTQLRRCWKSDDLISEETKEKLESELGLAEFVAWYGLVEVAFSYPVGPWTLSRRLISTFKAADQSLVTTTQRVTAVRGGSGEVRTADIECGGSKISYSTAYQSAFRELGILDLILDLQLEKPLVSGHAERGWPIYTRQVVPSLYEFLLPYYVKPGHIWSHECSQRRNARFPKELFEDMLDILKVEHPIAFREANVNQLKATVSRHLTRRTKNQKSSDLPR